MKKKYDEEKLTEEELLMISEFGHNPIKLFDSPHPVRETMRKTEIDNFVLLDRETLHLKVNSFPFKILCRK